MAPDPARPGSATAGERLVGGSVDRLSRRLLPVLLLVALAWVLGQVVAALATVVVPVAVAVLLAALLVPVADRLACRLPRVVATALTVLAGLAVVGGVVAFAVLSVGNSLEALGGQAARSLDGLRDLAGRYGVAPPPNEELVARARDGLMRATGGLTAAFSTLGTVLGGSFLTLFALVFFVHDRYGLWNGLLRLAPARRRADVDAAGRRAGTAVARYVRAVALIASIDALLIGVGLWLLDVPQAVPLAALVFLGGFVPYLGAVASGAVAVGVALVAGGAGTALVVLALVLAVQQLEGNVLQPWLEGRAVDLHPLLVVLAVAVGFDRAGVAGALFAVPLAAAVVATVPRGGDSEDGEGAQVDRSARADQASGGDRVGQDRTGSNG